MHECNKSNEIEQLRKAVYGNGKKGLVGYTVELFEKVDNFQKSTTKAVEEIQANVKVLVRFQTQMETKEKQEKLYEDRISTLKNNEIKAKRWRIIFASSTIIGMLGLIISLLTIIYKPPPKAIEKEQGVTEEKFKELWEEFKEENDIRGFVVGVDSIN